MLCEDFTIPCRKNSYGDFLTGDWFLFLVDSKPYIFCDTDLDGKSVSFPVSSDPWNLQINFGSNPWTSGRGFKCAFEVIDVSDNATEAPAPTSASTASPYGSTPSSSGNTICMTLPRETMAL